MYKKVEVKKVGIILGIIAVIIIVIAVTVASEPSEETQPFSEQAVTVENVRAALNKLTGTNVELGDRITNIQVSPYAGTENPDDFSVHVYFKPKNVWGGQYAMQIAVQTSIKAMEVLFQNQAVGEVVMYEQLDFMHLYGYTETETAIRLLMLKATADKITDWEVVSDRAQSDYNTFFELAELQYVHPAIAKEL